MRFKGSIRMVLMCLPEFAEVAEKILLVLYVFLEVIEKVFRMFLKKALTTEKVLVFWR